MTTAFENRVVLVTGGSTGIGAATALRLANAGARVLVTGRNEATLKESAARHERIHWLVADVGKAEDVARSVAEVRTRFGRLDVLVNNAGMVEIASLADASSEHVRRTLDTNLHGVIESTRAALPLLRQAKGNVVNVVSTVADRPFANMSVYSASKAAVLALTRAWAKELAGDGVRVNAVSPGPIETPIFAPDKLGISPAQLEQMGAAIRELVPMKRFGRSEEVAEVIAFVASSLASYVTGAEYTVGGGIEA
jgi:NAD(P)-dependent dehydrogenase (short-subunit alcohol dehydrogenase family)